MSDTFYFHAKKNNYPYIKKEDTEKIKTILEKFNTMSKFEYKTINTQEIIENISILLLDYNYTYYITLDPRYEETGPDEEDVGPLKVFYDVENYYSPELICDIIAAIVVQIFTLLDFVYDSHPTGEYNLKPKSYYDIENFNLDNLKKKYGNDPELQEYYKLTKKRTTTELIDKMEIKQKYLEISISIIVAKCQNKNHLEDIINHELKKYIKTITNIKDDLYYLEPVEQNYLKSEKIGQILSAEIPILNLYISNGSIYSGNGTAEFLYHNPPSNTGNDSWDYDEDKVEEGGNNALTIVYNFRTKRTDVTIKDENILKIFLINKSNLDTLDSKNYNNDLSQFITDVMNLIGVPDFVENNPTFQKYRPILRIAKK